jgi:ubiquitin-activating enzyme E1 C
MDVDTDNNNAPGSSNPDLARERHEREENERWRDLDTLLTRPSNLAGPGFEPCPELRRFVASDDCRILVVGAGGLGCELLKDLALSGFRHLDVIDMDTIDVSNLNRQFLFRTADVGQPKAVVAARKVEARVEGCRVTAHHRRIEDMPAEFYGGFTAIVLGLDSLEARRYMNGVVCGMLAFEDAASEEEEEGDDATAPGAKRRRSSPAPRPPSTKPPTVDLSTVKPVIDGGTEGFKGHARVILPGITPCFECTLWLFPPQVRFPLCTLAETPRTPAHCVEYAHLIRWGQDRPGEEFDADDEEHMAWVFRVASERAQEHGIAGVTLPLAQGVVKGIVPAVASTNAVVSAACVLETLKTITMCSQGLNNYMM